MLPSSFADRRFGILVSGALKNTVFADSPEIVIQGVTESGQRFRPSDWAERLCRMMSVFGADRHLNYLPYLKPVIAAGMCCVVVDTRLESADPEAFHFLLDFVKDNTLKLRPGRRKKRPQDVGGEVLPKRNPVNK